MGKYGFKEYAYDVLKALNKPLTAKEIWEEGQKLNLPFHTDGATPVATLGALLYVDIRDNEKTKFYIYSKKPTKFYISSQNDLSGKDVIKHELSKLPSKNESGYIYVLTNPSFPTYVKIGYADDVEQRVKVLNSRECTPFAFRIYATYAVKKRLQDVPLHDLIDKLNPTLRSKDEIEGRVRIREFYALQPDEALEILVNIARINGLEENIKVYNKSAAEKRDENAAEHIKKLSINRHHFKDIQFTSSLTHKHYIGKTNQEGTLSIIEIESGKEIENNSNPSKKAIIGQAILDYGGQTDQFESLYQRYRKLTKLVINKDK